jgi:hypothetical protein
MKMWKTKCLDMFEVPLPLLKEREKEGEAWGKLDDASLYLHY